MYKSSCLFKAPKGWRTMMEFTTVAQMLRWHTNDYSHEMALQDFILYFFHDDYEEKEHYTITMCRHVWHLTRCPESPHRNVWKKLLVTWHWFFFIFFYFLWSFTFTSPSVCSSFLCSGKLHKNVSQTTRTFFPIFFFVARQSNHNKQNSFLPSLWW